MIRCSTSSWVMPASPKALPLPTRNGCEEVFLSSPHGKRGSRGTPETLRPWIPAFAHAFAGMTGKADVGRLDTLAGADQVDRPLFAARGELCGKSRADRGGAVNQITHPQPVVAYS